MKKKWDSLYLKIISFCLVLLGFNACDKITSDDSEDDNTGKGGSGEVWDEYGSPWTTFRVIGEVVSKETQEPIENIQVILEPDRYKPDTVYTDIDGKFVVEGSDDFYQQLTVQFKDIDEEENGLFADKEVIIDLKNVELEGGDNWYQGHADIDMETVHLEPKEPEEPETPEEHSYQVKTK